MSLQGVKKNPDSGERRAEIAKTALVLGSLIAIFAGSLLVFSFIQLALGFRLSSLPFFLALLESGAIGCWAVKAHFEPRARKRAILAIASLFVLVDVLGLLICGPFHDVSPDRNHTQALILISRGWNPVRDGFYRPAPGEAIHYDGVNYYPKGTWICRAVLYKLTGRIELTKSRNLVLDCAAFFVAFAFFLTITRWPLPLAALLSSIVALNPVSATSLFSSFVDGEVASLINILVFLLLLLSFPNGFHTRFILITIGLTVTLLVNVKHNGAAFALVLCGGFVPYLYFRNRGLSYRLAGVFGASFTVGVFLIGYNPYVLNILRGDPFYPASFMAKAVGKGSEPDSYLQMNRFQKMAASLFSRSSLNPEDVELKLPFTMDPSELDTFSMTETRVGGFGPLFSGVLVLMALSAAMGLVLGRKRLDAVDGLPVMAGLILVSVFMSEQLWTARYAPQLFLLPVLIICCAAMVEKRSLKFLNSLMILALTANMLLVTGSYVCHQYQYSRKREHQLQRLSRSKEPVRVHFKGNCSGDSFTESAIFRERRIKFTPVDRLSCNAPFEIFPWAEADPSTIKE